METPVLLLLVLRTPATPVTRYKQYNAAFKVEVINSAKVFNNNSDAARKPGGE